MNVSWWQWKFGPFKEDYAILQKTFLQYLQNILHAPDAILTELMVRDPLFIAITQDITTFLNTEFKHYYLEFTFSNTALSQMLLNMKANLNPNAYKHFQKLGWNWLSKYVNSIKQFKSEAPLLWILPFLQIAFSQHISSINRSS